MKNILKIAAFALMVVVSSNAYADRLQNPQQARNVLQACTAVHDQFGASVERVNERVHKQSVQYSPKSGSITSESTMVWDRDLRMIMHYFKVDFYNVAQGPGASEGRCNNVVNFYSDCVDELYDNVTANVSVRHPTSGCLGRLYRTYELTPDDYYHGR